jgi:hypothetical protein
VKPPLPNNNNNAVHGDFGGTQSSTKQHKGQLVF